jgi:hypothetical protein
MHVSEAAQTSADTSSVPGSWAVHYRTPGFASCRHQQFALVRHLFQDKKVSSPEPLR